MNITDEIIQRVKDSNDIVDIVSETVRLKKSGRYYTGLCPFHSEKTPSFTVTPERQTFKCFGCGEGGNVISFVMKTRNLDFLDAVRLLADKANIELKAESSSSKKEKEQNEKLYRINVEAARYFFSKLRVSKQAAQYFTNRGITNSTIRKFGLGYSIDNWNELMRFMKAKGYSDLDLLNAGLIIKNEKNNLYDRFRNRVIFPVFDIKGRVIGFGGRVLDDSKPKYLNSPETAVFKKGINLYGLNFAVKNLKERTIIMVEGYMDCISLHQHGITNTVASLGTALTSNQAKLLRRYADKVIIAYDADIAGQTATLRGLEILRSEGFEINVLTVPKGKDPDEFIRTFGKDAFDKLVSNAIPLIDYKIQKAKEGIDFTKPEMVAEFGRKAVLILNELNPLQKDVYVKKISEDTGIKEQAIYDLIRGEIQKNVNKSDIMNIENDFGQKLYLEPAYMKAERNILRLMNENTEAYEYIDSCLKESDFIVESHRRLFKLIKEYINVNYEERQKLVELKCVDIETSKEYVHLTETEFCLSDNDYVKFINDCIKDIKRFKFEAMKKDIINKVKHLEVEGKIEDSLKLAQQLLEVKKQLDRL